MEESNRYTNKFKKKVEENDKPKSNKKLQAYKKPKYKKFNEDDYV